MRDALALVKPPAASSAPDNKRQEWLRRLDGLRESVGTGKTWISTEAIIEDIRSERG